MELPPITRSTTTYENNFEILKKLNAELETMEDPGRRREVEVLFRNGSKELLQTFVLEQQNLKHISTALDRCYRARSEQDGTYIDPMTQDEVSHLAWATPDNHCYGEEGASWIEENRTDPVTRKQLTTEDLLEVEKITWEARDRNGTTKTYSHYRRIPTVKDLPSALDEKDDKKVQQILDRLHNPMQDRELLEVLKSAAEEGREDVVKLLIEKKVNVPYEAIKLAVEKGHTEVAKLLLDNRYFPYAVMNGDIEIVDLFMEEGMDTDTAKKGFAMAASKNHIEIVKLLIDKNVTTDKYDDENALEMASMNGHTAMVTLLLHHQTHSNVLKRRALVAAAKAGHIDVVRLLLDKGVLKRRALVAAAKAGHIDVVRLLLDKGVKPKKNARIDAVKVATSNGHYQIVEVLLNNGFEAKSKALVKPISKGHLEVVKLFLRHGVKLPLPEFIISGFIKLVQRNNLRMIEFLLKNGAERCAMMKSKKGELPLVEAVRVRDKHNIEMIRLLLINGANANLADGQGRTALVLACNHNEYRHDGFLKVKLLLKGGADPNISSTSEYFSTKHFALSTAIRNRHTNIVKLLLEGGAKPKESRGGPPPLVVAAMMAAKMEVQDDDILFQESLEIIRLVKKLHK